MMKYGVFAPPPLSMVEVIWFTEWLIAMSWLPKREKLDPKQASAIDFAVAQDGNFYVSGKAGTGKSVVLAAARMMV